MAKAKTQFVCRSCGAMSPRWMGKCNECGEWDGLEEVKQSGRGAGLDPHRGIAPPTDSEHAQAKPITDVVEGDEQTAGRIATSIGEFDRVLGGAESLRGIVPGSATMLGGDPGIGKSTLMLQAAIALARRGQTVLYVTSEESAGQLRLRAERLATTLSNGKPAEQGLPQELFVLADTNLARIAEQARKLNPVLLVIDSIQMVYKGDLPAAPGSVTQLRACCLELVYHAKSSGSALMLVGHVTKQGALAGPRLLEHMVDTVLYFEGDRYHSHRVVRGVKNRFGSTLEVGLFEMTDRGLLEVEDGVGLLAAEYQPRSGSVVCPVLSGTRCLLIEMQALTATGFLGSAKRKVSGLDRSRLDMLIAVLEKRGGLRLADQDVFASSVGGMRVGEPAADLPVALAIAGAHLDRQLDHGTCAVGEIGLGGEIRSVQQAERRIVEAARMGFKRIVCPDARWPKVKGAKLVPVKTLDHALQQLG
ncbi:MAG: DNA repair protein RadA [Planctomycetota bacterium]